mgnify:CR=1 FL=1
MSEKAVAHQPNTEVIYIKTVISLYAVGRTLFLLKLPMRPKKFQPYSQMVDVSRVNSTAYAMFTSVPSVTHGFM